MKNEISSLLKEDRIINPQQSFVKQAHIKSLSEYERLYSESINNPEKFWAEMADSELHWFKKWDQVLRYDFSKIGEERGAYIEWFKGAKLNVSYNCLDRHVSTWRRNKAAIIWQAENELERRTLTYQELFNEVCRFTNVLRKHGVTRGTTVTIFMPLVPELAIAMLACARLGAIHSVVFSAFSADSLRSRIKDCASQVVISADIGYHAGRVVDLKNKVDQALLESPSVKKTIIFNRGDCKINMQPGRDYWWHEEMNAADITNQAVAEENDAEDPLFILYTSGSTGKPKGVLHTTAGYSLYTHLTFKWIFDIKEEDIFWCTADIGWITGHSYVVYGPLSNGATVLMYEGAPTYPQADRFWKIIEDYKVNIFYTAPTAIRSLMRLDDDWPKKHNLSSLRLLGSVGEPINPEAWIWYYKVIGQEKCPIVDTWWQTETGGIMISTLPGAMNTKPGSAGKPFFGVVPKVIKEGGSEAETNAGGNLVISKPWPGMLRGVYGDKQNSLIKQVYFSQHAQQYFTGDGARVDQDGYFWLLGRIDDVINVSAHRFATAEIESALVSHESVAEAAVVGFEHEIKGQGIYCFVTLKQGFSQSEELRKTLVGHVRNEISPIATPDKIHFAMGLPKTRSGKIMRRILRKIAEGKVDEVGDISTLADPLVVEELIRTT